MGVTFHVNHYKFINMNLIAYRPHRKTIRRNVNTAYRPAINILETENDFRLELVAPGFAKENFELDLEDQTLTLRGQREVKETEGVEFIRHDFRVRNFERRFELPESVDTDAVAANYENGILTLTLPKREEAKPLPARRIEIG